jgi:hypothetical protein
MFHENFAWCCDHRTPHPDPIPAIRHFRRRAGRPVGRRLDWGCFTECAGPARAQICAWNIWSSPRRHPVGVRLSCRPLQAAGWKRWPRAVKCAGFLPFPCAQRSSGMRWTVTPASTGKHGKSTRSSRCTIEVVSERVVGWETRICWGCAFGWESLFRSPKYVSLSGMYCWVGQVRDMFLGGKALNWSPELLSIYCQCRLVSGERWRLPRSLKSVSLSGVDW